MSWFGSAGVKPLAWLVRRFPGPFGLAWIDDETLVKVDERTYDMRPVRYLASVEARWLDGGDQEREA